MQPARRSIVALLVVGLGTLLGVAGHLSYRAYLSERDYLLGLLVLELVEDYVADHGDWPRSWRDLEGLQRPERGGWPADSPTVKDCIHVDFHAKVKDLAGQDVAQFRAVHPIRAHPLFDDDHWRRSHLGPLLDRLRRLDERGRH